MKGGAAEGNLQTVSMCLAEELGSNPPGAYTTGHSNCYSRLLDWAWGLGQGQAVLPVLQDLRVTFAMASRTFPQGCGEGGGTRSVVSSLEDRAMPLHLPKET